ncbi:MAG: DUF424 family protein [Thermoplasmata archaeon]|nr:DUF424 family protein [Thermoplasmata archaeon]
MSRKKVTTGGSGTEPAIYLKVHRRGPEILVAACDADLVDEYLKDEKFSVHLSPEFYKGELVTDEVFLIHMGSATVANLFGKHTVGLAIRAGFVDKENVLKIAGVPHAQMVVM